jgi:hypothetical protein
MPGRYYDLDARRVSAVTVTEGSNTLVAGTDYDINTEHGVLYIRPDGSVQSGDDLSVNFTQAAVSIQKIRMGKVGQQICRVLYLADDVNQDGAGARDRLELWRVDIAPAGELALISDDYGNFTLSGAILTDASHPDEPYGSLQRIVA